MITYVIFFLLILIAFKLFETSEYYGSIPTFYSGQSTREFFTKDVDGYLKTLTDTDIKAQRATDKSDYLSKISLAADDFTLNEKIKLIKATIAADSWIRNKMPKITGVDSTLLSDMPWVFALTRGRAYEEGLPHTRKDVIFLSDDVLTLPDKLLKQTLIHEKVHVYERKYPQLVQEWMDEQGYIRHRRQSDYKLSRSNPDVDGWVYINPEGKETVVMYRSENPKNIEDVIYPGPQHPNTEHPYETLAYMIDNIYDESISR